MQKLTSQVLVAYGSGVTYRLRCRLWSDFRGATRFWKIKKWINLGTSGNNVFLIADSSILWVQSNIYFELSSVSEISIQSKFSFKLFPNFDLDRFFKQETRLLPMCCWFFRWRWQNDRTLSINHFTVEWNYQSVNLAWFVGSQRYARLKT